MVNDTEASQGRPEAVEKVSAIIRNGVESEAAATDIYDVKMLRVQISASEDNLKNPLITSPEARAKITSAIEFFNRRMVMLENFAEEETKKGEEYAQARKQINELTHNGEDLTTLTIALHEMGLRAS